jgi:hypothetical protein
MLPAAVVVVRYFMMSWSLEDPARAQGLVAEKKNALAREGDEIRQNAQAFFDEFSKERPEFTKAASA